MTALCCHIRFQLWAWGEARDLNVLKMSECMPLYFRCLNGCVYNRRHKNVIFLLCTTLLRKRCVLAFLGNILKTCFILEKQNTINIGHNIIPVSETQNGNLICGFVLPTLCECRVNGAAVYYWEEESEYMRQSNATLPPWDLLNINTQQHSRNVQQTHQCTVKKEVRAAGWNAGIIQTLDLVERDEIFKTVKSGDYKILCCLCCSEIVAISPRKQKWRPCPLAIGSEMSVIQ